MHEFANEISRHVWQTKYKFVDRSVSERSIPILGAASHAFLPRSSVFLRFKKNFGFLPGGRIQAGAGTARDVTLFNCFVMA